VSAAPFANRLRTAPPVSQPHGCSGKHDRKTLDQGGEPGKLVGKIAAELDRLGLRENTPLVFASDNGTDASVTLHLNGRKVKGEKGKMTEGNAKVARRPPSCLSVRLNCGYAALQ